MLLTLRTPGHPWSGSSPAIASHGGAAATVVIAGGRAHRFHPAADSVTVMVETDPAAAAARFPAPALYAAGAPLAEALGRLLVPARGGDDDLPREVEVTIPVLACSRGEGVLARMFAPLGYAVEASRIPLDPARPWEEHSWLYAVRLSGCQAPSAVVSHLRVLLPFFDDAWLGGRRGDAAAEPWVQEERWIAAHPEAPLLERRLRPAASPPTLHDSRHDAVLAELLASGARRVLDLGCGTGALLRRLLGEPRFDEVVGVEVARDSLARARASLAPGGRGRVLHGSVAYRDPRLAGFDAAAVVEVIEHLDPPQLAAFEDVIWRTARPGTVVLTTPNAEYNTLFEYHRGGRLRHPDHRFEWTRDEFQAWARGVAGRHGYDVRFGAAGPEDARVGPLTQMAVFERRPSAAPETVDDGVGTDALDLSVVAGGRTIATRRGGTVRVREDDAAAAVEALSRFAADPRWLVYLPPATPAAAPRAGAGEDPSAALAYYRDRGVATAAVQTLHPGTRVVAVVCRDQETARRRFGAARGATGAVYTAEARPYFTTRAAEEEFLARLRQALDAGAAWDEPDGGWVAIEGVMGPGVALMPEVDSRLGPAPARFWAVGAGARRLHEAAEAELARAAAAGGDLAPLRARNAERAALARAFQDVCRRECWPLHTPRGLRLAPVRVLAGDGGVHAEREPGWHLHRLGPACRAAPDTLTATEQVVADLAHPSGRGRAAEAWTRVVARGDAGVVVRPVGEGTGGGALVPALKCRTEAALLLALGPEHRLAGADGPPGGAAGRAAREWALSLEALDRFVRGEPLARVHECVAAALALRLAPGA